MPSAYRKTLVRPDPQHAHSEIADKLPRSAYLIAPAPPQA